MSWFGAVKAKEDKAKEAELREAKRLKLEEDRLARAQKRAERQKLLQSAIEAQQEADQVIKDLQSLDPDIFEGDSNASEVTSDILDDTEDSATMPDDNIVNFEDEDGNDNANAMQEACRNLQRLEFEESDLDFWFSQVEIKMGAVGVKKNFTKFQVLSSIIPTRR